MNAVLGSVYRTQHEPALGSTSDEIPRGPSKLLPLIIPRYERAARATMASRLFGAFSFLRGECA